MIRPSSLKIGRYCTLAPALSERFPDRSDAASYGSEVDRLVTGALGGHRMIWSDPKAYADAIICVTWIERELVAKGWRLRVQEKVRLRDLDTGGLLTEGTPDIVALKDDEVVIVDLKKREQYWAGRLDDIDIDLQTHAYAIASVMSSEAKRYRKAYLLFGDGEVQAMWSQDYEEKDWQPILDEIRQLEMREIKATRGTHCLSCYPRQHCPAWLLPEGGVETALAPLSRPGGLSLENAGQALELYKRAEDLMEKVGEQLKDFARKNGGITVGDRKWAPVLMAGRKSANVAALEAAGLKQYVREGGRFEQFRWLRAR
jgi:hypothetical protein